ncbi:hypothetical protein [Nocardia goodfellowii]|uniref:RiboL-PSP-HEPN domain-containing protein n=1 Tax=Nocardia goodfellowii TaxID=882446 RepID=A0ABS4QR61_9NOCA|nr:hypothetical protein [Nocardia goodfellowii]MBP2193613.1 hypothetical protein [Nocardia goodfellowii]
MSSGAGEPSEVAAEAGDHGNAFDVGSIRVREHLAASHLWTAELMASRCEQREKSLVQDGFSGFDREHRSLSTAAVLFSVFFIEAYINEVFDDLADGNPVASAGVTGLDEQHRKTLARLWKSEDLNLRGTGTSILAKYDLALIALNKPSMDRGQPPFEGVKRLIALRNSLVHFKPKWTDVGSETKGLAVELQGEQFPGNAIPIGDPWYPNKCMGAGCAMWACSTARSFADGWRLVMGITSDFRVDVHDWSLP